MSLQGTEKWTETSEQNDISEKVIQDFLLGIQENFWENERENKKYLQIQLKEKFWIENIRVDWIERMYEKVIESDNWNVYWNKEFLIIDEILKLQRRSESLEKAEEKIINKTEEDIKENIKQYLEIILKNWNEADKFNEKYIYDEIQKYTWEIEESEQVEIKQTELQIMWKEYILIALVVGINWKKVDIDLLKNKNTWKIVKNHITKADFDLMWNPLSWWEKKWWVLKKLYDNPDAGIELSDEHKLDLNKFNLGNEKEIKYENNHNEEVKRVNLSKDIRDTLNKEEWNKEKKEKEEELLKFIQITKEWNKVFKQNKNDLEWLTDEKQRKTIISKNAQKIANLFADNATLQWTMDFDNSAWFEWIKEYFEHFLAKSPTMRFKKINEITKIEDGLLYAQWDYDFEVDDENGWRTHVDANFAFYLEKNNEGRWWIKRLNSTFWKSEDNLKYIKPKEQEKQD